MLEAWTETRMKGVAVEVAAKERLREVGEAD